MSRWTAKVRVQRLDNSTAIKARPLFFVAKEGKLANEDGVFKVFKKQDGSIFKLQHGLGNLTYEMVEFGSDRYVNMTSLKAIQVPDEMTWQLDKIWRQNYSLLNNSNGLIDTKTPNVVFVRPSETPDGFEFVIHYSKQQFASEYDADYYTEIMYQNFTEVVNNFTRSVSEAQTNFTQYFSAVFGDSYKDLLDTMPLALDFG